MYALWKIEESQHDLMEMCTDGHALEEELISISSQKIRDEKAATRACLNALMSHMGLSYEGIYRDEYRCSSAAS